MSMRVICAERLMSDLLLRSELSNTNDAMDYVMDCNGLDELRDIMLFPSNRYLSNPSQHHRNIGDAKRMYSGNICHLMMDTGPRSLWLCDSIMTCFGRILNAVNPGHVYSFSATMTASALKFSDGPGNSIGLPTNKKKRASNAVTKLMDPPSMKQLDLMSHDIWFLPVNMTGDHWICYTVLLQEKKIILFDPMAYPDEQSCLKSLRHQRNERHSSVAKVMHAIRVRARVENIVIPSTGECWDAFTYHPLQSKIQTDCENCGVYVLLWMRAIAKRAVFDGNLILRQTILCWHEPELYTCSNCLPPNHPERKGIK
jgi:hypothetical protein